MSEEKLTIDGFGDVEMDAIGEIMNNHGVGGYRCFKYAFSQGMDHYPAGEGYQVGRSVVS